MPGCTTAATTATSAATATVSVPTVLPSVGLGVFFEHGCVFEHVREDDEADPGAADVNRLQVRNAAISSRVRDVAQQAVHVVLNIDHLPSVNFTALELHCHSEALPFVQHHCGYADCSVAC